MNWWEDDKWGKSTPMNYPDHRRGARTQKLPDDTDPELFSTSMGQLRLRLVPADPPRPPVTIYTGRIACPPSAPKG